MMCAFVKADQTVLVAALLRIQLLLRRGRAEQGLEIGFLKGRESAAWEVCTGKWGDEVEEELELQRLGCGINLLTTIGCSMWGWMALRSMALLL